MKEDKRGKGQGEGEARRRDIRDEMQLLAFKHLRRKGREERETGLSMC